jgi:superfamily II DNA or RNA helicase
MKLRGYQAECVNKINEMNNIEKKICYMATGAGKTVIMGTVAKQSEGRVLIVVDQSELREQTIDKIKLICGDDISIGSVQGKLNEVDKKIVVATRQSLTHCKSNRLDQILENGNFDVVMIDECHRACHQIKKIVDSINEKCKVIGFTATPWNTELKAIFDGFVYEKEILELIEEGYLCSPRCFRIQTDTDLSGIKTIAGEFAQSELSIVVDSAERNNLIVKAYLDKAKDRKHTIVFATSIEHAAHLSKAFNRNGISAKSIDSTLDSTEREQVLSGFKTGEFKVLVNVAILTTGFDFEELDCVIMARPTKSKILYTQCLGRGIRIAEGKEDCLVLDIVDNVVKHSLINTKSIFDMEDGETILEAKERRVYEKKEKEIQLQEQKKIEEEQEKLRLEEIELFNNNIYNVAQISNLDWYFNKINGDVVSALSVKPDTDYYIVKVDSEYNSYKCTKFEGYKYELNLIDTNKNLNEIVEDIERSAIKKGSSFINKYSTWKYEGATDKQIAACKNNKYVKTKWDAHKFFSKRNMYFALKNII